MEKRSVKFLVTLLVLALIVGQLIPSLGTYAEDGDPGKPALENVDEIPSETPTPEPTSTPVPTTAPGGEGGGVGGGEGGGGGGFLPPLPEKEAPTGTPAPTKEPKATETPTKAPEPTSTPSGKEKIEKPAQVKWVIKKNTPIASNKAGRLTIKYRKVKNATGYQVCYSTSKTFKTKNTTSLKGLTKTLKNLKSGKTYYVKVRAFYKNEQGKRVYGPYSKVKKIKVK